MSRQSRQPRHSGARTGHGTGHRAAPARKGPGRIPGPGPTAYGAEDATAAYSTTPHRGDPHRGEQTTAPYRAVDETLALRSAAPREEAHDSARHEITVELPTALTGAPSRGDEPDPVFVDSSGGRRRLLRKFGWLVGVASLGYAVVLGVSLAGGDAGAPDVLIPGPEKKASDKVDPSPSKSGTSTPGVVADPTPETSTAPADDGVSAPAEEAEGGGGERGREPVGRQPSATRPQTKPATRPATRPTPTSPSDRPKPSDTEDPPPDPGPDPDPGEETAAGAGGAG